MSRRFAIISWIGARSRFLINDCQHHPTAGNFFLKFTSSLY
jgi:hypothetical protein